MCILRMLDDTFRLAWPICIMFIPDIFLSVKDNKSL